MEQIEDSPVINRIGDIQADDMEMPLFHTLLTDFSGHLFDFGRHSFENIHHYASFPLPIELFADFLGVVFPPGQAGEITADRVDLFGDMRGVVVVYKIAYLVAGDDLFELDHLAYQHGNTA